MSNQAVGLNRDSVDKYYTKPEVVGLCLNELKKHVFVDVGDLLVEPSAGDGAFVNELVNMSDHCLFYDIDPQHSHVEKLDYLNIDTSVFTGYPKVHVIGNPPFGRQSSTAKKFIKKSCEYCDSISFILPRSFMKDSMKKSIPLHFHLLYEMILPEYSFLVNDKDYDVPCIFQIWEKKNIIRDVPEVVDAVGYKFVKKSEDPDLSFRRVGVYAGKVTRDIEDKSEQSHYFIKTNKPLTKQQFDLLKNMKFTCKDNTVGARSISKPEVICRYNEVFS
tara:strand:+ start:6740 stop:7564 length:825 start_codon:yes stop_codon:yes gene_type:complete